jgi:hypothetical protein
LSRRKALGFFCTFVKCSSHDKDPDQDARISLWNNRADGAAEKARLYGPFASEWWTKGDLDHVFLHNGCTVRGDPRAHIRSNWELGAAYHAASLTRRSSLAALTLAEPPEVAAGPLRVLHSSTRLARAGLYSAQGFLFCLHNSCLRTPWNSFSGADSEHLDSEYPVTASIRGELRSAVASLLIGLYSAHDYEGDNFYILMAWFALQVEEDSSSVSIFAEPLGITNKVVCVSSSADRNNDYLSLNPPHSLMLSG